jgi:hypothetical protein
MYDNGEKRYRIKLVGERDLPADQDFAFMECDGQVWLALKKGRLTAPVLEVCWATFRQMAS